MKNKKSKLEKELKKERVFRRIFRGYAIGIGALILFGFGMAVRDVIKMDKKPQISTDIIYNTSKEEKEKLKKNMSYAEKAELEKYALRELKKVNDFTRTYNYALKKYADKNKDRLLSGGEIYNFHKELFGNKKVTVLKGEIRYISNRNLVPPDSLNLWLKEYIKKH